MSSTFRTSVLFVLALLVTAASAPCADTASSHSAGLRIEIRSADGDRTVLEPYVAVVAETAPWAEPTRETVIDEGSSIAWRLPPGRYRVAAGAPGHAITYGRTIELEAGSTHRERVAIPPMTRIEGRVVDEEGRPIPGATVSHLRRLVHDFSLELSSLGEEHLRGSFEGVADDHGRFRVHVPPEAGTFLAVRADGWAPRFFPNLKRANAEADLHRVVLAQGGSLVVGWPKAEGAAPLYDRVLLEPADRDAPPGLDRALALVIWTRPYPGPGHAEWSSLPPGRYTIRLKAPPRGAHEVVPVDLGQVSIPAGGRLEERLNPPSAPPGSMPPDIEVEKAGAVEVLLPTLSTSELETLAVRGWWGPGSGEPQELAFTVRRASGGTVVRVERACRPETALTLVTESRMGALTLNRAACGIAHEVPRLVLTPRADLELRVTAPAGADLPSVGRLSVGPCVSVEAVPTAGTTNDDGSSASLVRLELSAPIEVENGRGIIRTPTAAGCTSVTARIGDFAALDWPDLQAEASSTVDLGTHRLRFGAALLARVISGIDGRPIDGIVVRALDPDRALAALQGADAGPAARTEVTSTGRGAAVTSQGGWARLHGLPPGRDLVVLLQDEERRRPHPAADIRLSPGEERMLDFLELPPPASVEIRIALSRRLEEIEAVPYQVFLRQTDTSGPPLSVSREVGAERTVLFEDLPPGTWRLEGIARLSDGKPFPAGSKEIELAVGERRVVDLELADSLYEGRVTYEGVPVAGSMSVTPVAPADRRGMTVLLDEDGRFRLPLEGPGTYTVRIYDERDQRFSGATIAAVEFGDPEDEVTIRVPEGRIAGMVIGERGNPVPGATVLLQSRQDTPDERFRTVQITARTSPSGDFLAEGLDAGVWTLTANAGELDSSAVVVAVAPDERVGAVELVLDQTEKVNGVVTDEMGQPVAGAQLLFNLEPGSPHEVPTYSRATTDHEGRFQTSAASAGRVATLRVQTPAGAVHAFRIELVPDLRLRLPPASGRVALELPCAHTGAWVSGNYFLVAQTGAFLPVASLFLGDKTNSSDGCRVLRTAPGLAIGAWRIVRVTTPADEALLLYGQGGMLESHGELLARPGAPATVVVEAEELRSSSDENRSER